jgi:hypothetical protein
MLFRVVRDSLAADGCQAGPLGSHNGNDRVATVCLVIIGRSCPVTNVLCVSRQIPFVFVRMDPPLEAGQNLIDFRPWRLNRIESLIIMVNARAGQRKWWGQILALCYIGVQPDDATGRNGGGVIL